VHTGNVDYKSAYFLSTPRHRCPCKAFGFGFHKRLTGYERPVVKLWLFHFLTFLSIGKTRRYFDMSAAATTNSMNQDIANATDDASAHPSSSTNPRSFSKQCEWKVGES
jgi:hypothetical protein